MKPIVIDGKFTGYSISQIGLVYNEFTRKFLKGNIRADGYHRVKLHYNNKAIAYYVHRLVAEAFIPNPNNYNQINHIDNNRSNNSFENLEWSTQKMNMEHKVRQDRQAKGEKSGQAKLKETEIIEIRQKYSTGNFSQRELARQFKVDQRLIWSIIHRETWKHI